MKQKEMQLFLCYIHSTITVIFECGLQRNVFQLFIYLAFIAALRFSHMQQYTCVTDACSKASLFS